MEIEACHNKIGYWMSNYWFWQHFILYKAASDHVYVLHTEYLLQKYPTTFLAPYLDGSERRWMKGWNKGKFLPYLKVIFLNKVKENGDKTFTSFPS